MARRKMQPPPSSNEKNGQILPLSEENRRLLAGEIELANYAEVLSAVTVTENRTWSDLRVLARGTIDQAPVILRGLRCGDVLLHNHPSGDLRPSAADLQVAAICGKSGIGFAIHDNQAQHAYVVVEPSGPEKVQLLDAAELSVCLSHRGALAQAIPGYEERPGQQAMLKQVVQALNSSNHALLEGETGVGKSFAYLLPAATFAKRQQCRVVISTNTINLQQQLCRKDLPLIKELFEPELSFCLVKGRSNYLCRRRLWELEHSTENYLLLDLEEVEQYNRLAAWAEDTKDGTLSDLTWVPEPELWEKMNAERDTCLGVRCHFYQDCFFYRARRLAAEADLLVVNHHLLLSDIALRSATAEYHQTAVIPAYKAAIVDEAHNLEDIATKHFGHRTTLQALIRLLNKIYHRRKTHDKGVLAVIAAALRRGAGSMAEKKRARILADITERIVPHRLETGDKARTTFDSITDILTKSSDTIMGDIRLRLDDKNFATQDKQALTRLCLDLADDLESLRKMLLRLRSSFIGEPDDEASDLDQEFIGSLLELKSYLARLQGICESLRLFFDEEEENRAAYVHFLSVAIRRRQSFPGLFSAPLAVGPHLVEHFFQRVPCVCLVSATLTTEKNFVFIKDRLGLDQLQDKPAEGRFSSPFLYREQARIFVPTDLPEANDPCFQEAAITPIYEIILTSRGGALVLCTSYAFLSKLHSALSSQLAADGMSVFRQGDMERHHLLEEFRSDGNAVLFATDSFWEGVDVPGTALRNLVITKLPFSVPNDPILEARQEILQKEGRNPFREYQVPMASIKLKQGFGRLIRSKTDFGTVWILDKRIVTKFYGRFFLSSLPPAPVRQGASKALVKEACSFFQQNA